jgi:TRAP-type C4-dicarboxylate transport system permease small subunit
MDVEIGNSEKLVRRAISVFGRVNDACAYVAMALAYVIMLSVTFDAAMTFFASHPQNWAPEITEYSLVAITFLGSAWVLRRGQHVRIDTLLVHLKPQTRRWFDVITSMICASVCAVITWYGAKVTWQHYQMHYTLPTVLEPPSYITMLLVPVGSLLLCVQFVIGACQYWRGVR